MASWAARKVLILALLAGAAATGAALHVIEGSQGPSQWASKLVKTATPEFV
jgi:hypothetical protein